MNGPGAFLKSRKRMILAPLPFGMKDTPEKRRMQAWAEGRDYIPRWRCGVIFRLASFWVGVHYSEKMGRWCINLLPGVTFWIAKPGGQVPEGIDFKRNWELK